MANIFTLNVKFRRRKIEMNKYSLRYLSFEDAMKVCSELGDLNSHLVPFAGPEEFKFFYEKSKFNPAVQRYCNHGDRKMFWLPYRNRYCTFQEHLFCILIFLIYG